MKLFSNRIIFFLASAVGSSLAIGGDYFTGPYGKNGTWNLYTKVDEQLSWMEAFKAASKPDPLGKTKTVGHLVTISSMEENMFVKKLTLYGDAWIGLTDNEIIKGAKESDGRRSGWAWVTGEPVDFAHWSPGEPNDGGEAGEDGVQTAFGGLWNDLPAGIGKQERKPGAYIVEWDIQADAPVPGAEVITPILPSELPAMPIPKEAAAESGAWRWTAYAKADAKLLRSHARLSGTTPFSSRVLNHYQGYNRNGGGWLPLTERYQPPAASGPFGARFHSTLKIEEAGPYTFCVHADDHFACRIGKFEWKSSTGWGGIDPLDRTTLYQEVGQADGWALGVIELPVGEHPIAVVHSNWGGNAFIQVLAARGAFQKHGDTHQWRLLGHRPRAEVPWPGIDPKGWTVRQTAPVPPAGELGLQDALLKLKTDPKVTTTKGVKQISYYDPDTPGQSRFTPLLPFVGDKPNNVDRFVLQATGTLVIPSDGLYHLGFHGVVAGALRIKGAKWRTKARDSSQRARINGDTIYRDPGWILTDSQVVGEISLKKGTYEIEVLFPRNRSIAHFAVFGSAAGYPPRLLRAGGAEITKDHPGIPLVPITFAD